MRSAFELNRRAFLGRYAGCLGSLALTHLLRDDAYAGGGPLSTRSAHHASKAKAVICLFQHGGPSQMDLFDYKPELNRRSGQAYSGQLEVHFHTQIGKLLGSPYKFRRFGQSEMELSEL